MHSGILLVDKPEGPSSAHVVHKVKNILQVKKVGHLGTLDPFASGLLLLGINEGTKIADIFLSAPKSYQGVIALGVATDTQDSTGKVLARRVVSSVGKKEIQVLERNFTGALQQTPPMYSALKRDGVRLYRLARQGKNVPRQPRAIRVERLRLRPVDPTHLEIEVTCSRGTYIRTLAADMGELLGCGAHLESLKRLACGHLTLDRAVSLSEIEDLQSKNSLPLISLNQAVGHLRRISWEIRWLSRLRMGQQEVLGQLGKPQQGETMVRIVDIRDNLIALAEWNEDATGGRWRLVRVFRS
jgi:tRNA pseudouridine55 synthase